MTINIRTATLDSLCADYEPGFNSMPEADKIEVRKRLGILYFKYIQPYKEQMAKALLVDRIIDAAMDIAENASFPEYEYGSREMIVSSSVIHELGEALNAYCGD